jgi:hypothetical protein
MFVTKQTDPLKELKPTIRPELLDEYLAPLFSTLRPSICISKNNKR